MNLEQIHEAVEAAIEPAYRGKLLARGQARSMIWRDGVLPEGAPPFARTLSYDLLCYGDSLLSLAMRIREQDGDEELACSAFEHAGGAIEAVVSKGNPEDPHRGFLRLLSASAFHLGHLSARAFSMLAISLQSANLSPIEKALALLILRSLDEIENEIVDWKIKGMAADGRLVEDLAAALELADVDDRDEESFDPVQDTVDKALTDVFYTGLGTFIVALQTGEEGLVEDARASFLNGLEQCATLSLVPQWWCFRLAAHLIDDLWQSSFHNILPRNPPGDGAAEWHTLRSLFIAILLRRRRAEIELWPSQIGAAHRAVDINDDLVVSLPTSAGKTRVAELCILRCLSNRKRVVFVTPLRALSAQTELSLQRTFGPLGKRISALYGSIGTSSFEEDALKSRDIVVATPEKLDFALRNDPAIIDDVGLIVLDEGHMIGLGEREVRYEVQIQRLLKRDDADQRRIVCLSAILPEGNQFDDFVSWIRRDKEGGAVANDWRPTRIRFGEVLWRGDHARLDLRVGDETPFVPKFFGQRAPTSGQRKALFPRTQRELVLATACRLVEDEQSVLIYCPERRSVEPYARAIVDLASRGFIEPVLTVDQATLKTTLEIGREWLGDNHPILDCLRLGVAIHHGALPTPFRKEVERLLREGVLKITVSSPTLAQGLNLTATTIIMHDIQHFRGGKRKVIDISSFKNVIGRAGRAFVDVEGLVLFPIFSNHDNRRGQWHKLINSTSGHEMESGLVRLVLTFLVRLNRALNKPGIADLQEYVLNNAAAWDFPEIDEESADNRQQAERDWQQYLDVFDTAILSLLGEQDLQADEIAARLDNVLSSSLWQRRIAHRNQEVQDLLRSGLISRANAIWANSTALKRRGYFLAGVGLGTGQQLDAVSNEANQLLIEANSAMFDNDRERAIAAITELAEIIFDIDPFIPDPFPNNWRDILAIWLNGEPFSGGGIDVDSDVLRFVENGLVYKLPWGMEAIRVRAQANADEVGGVLGSMTIDAFEVGLAAPAVETGTLNRCAAMLMQAGFTSRLAAIKAINDTNAGFTNSHELQAWINSDEVKGFSEDVNWPTPESHIIWNEFLESYIPRENAEWSIQRGRFPVSWLDSVVPPLPGTIVKLYFSQQVGFVVMSAGLEFLGYLGVELAGEPAGVFNAKVSLDSEVIEYLYQGPDDIRGVAV